MLKTVPNFLIPLESGMHDVFTDALAKRKVSRVCFFCPIESAQDYVNVSPRAQ